MSQVQPVDISKLPVEPTPTERKVSHGRFLAHIRHYPLVYVGGVIILILVLVAIFAPFIAPHNPDTQFPNGLTQNGSPISPNQEFPLGTDGNGRGILSRVIYGTRVSLTVGFLSMMINLFLGIIVGMFSGYYGGWIDVVLMRLTDVVLAFPLLLFVMALVAVLRPSLWNILFALGILGWGTMARLVRGQVLAIKEHEFVLAARSIGASNLRIIFLHILPNVIGPVIVFSTLSVGNNILATAGLSYLGLGVQPPTPDWGEMISQGLQTYMYAPWTLYSPGIALSLSVLGFNLLGDGLRDILDPQVQTSNAKK